MLENFGIATWTLGSINAYQEFDFHLPDRKFCTSCWTWLGPSEHECSQCGPDGSLVDPANPCLAGGVIACVVDQQPAITFDSGYFEECPLRQVG